MSFLSRMASDVQLMLRRPARLQFAALCYRESKKGMEILLITSRDTGRWVIPKGWPMNGKLACEAAAREAYEEAGVHGTVGNESIGAFKYRKKLNSGVETECRVDVYPISVSNLVDKFPEAGQRTRVWMTPEDAASSVDEPELQHLILEFAKR
ncbi:NUDIX hydrolase [Rhizobium sp. L1K21]|uniref:NUDIX hydrolase n=1 Tax=Rhizobium sp. L1K21 TaxID=2954933 RepID=UPI002093FDDD|nr:NUDIX hydrolase [Rhizobium sp. L1K21]MCO6187015.1 NUDIX hydrolase [Rhizobium sp. L1K21]